MAPTPSARRKKIGCLPHRGALRLCELYAYSGGRHHSGEDSCYSGAPVGSSVKESEPAKLFKTKDAWAKWLEKHHRTSTALWLRFAKKNSGIQSVSYQEALDVALCYGWIDAQLKGENEATYLQRFVRRSDKSLWSKVNREKALAFIASGEMQAAGLEAVEKAKQSGRWEGAYDSSSKATVPHDFQRALDTNAGAKSFFETLDKANRYAILWRLQTTRKPETRARKLKQFIEMLARGEKIHN